MSNIKIINILKEDTFDEIIDLFRSSTATDVVFVVPKKTKVFSKQDHFAQIGAAAQESDRRVSFMSASPQVAALAKAYQFDVLDSATSAVKTKPVVAELARTKRALSDDDLHRVPDYSKDQYDEDVPVTSDEKIFDADAEKTEEDAFGIHEEDEDEEDQPLDDDAEASKEVEDLDEEERDQLDDEDEEDEDEESAYEDDEIGQDYAADDAVAEGFEGDGEATLAASRVSLDGVVATSGKDRRPVSVRPDRRGSRRVPVRNQTEESIWSEQPGRDTLWERFFRTAGKKQTPTNPVQFQPTSPTPPRRSYLSWTILIVGGLVVLGGAALYVWAPRSWAKITVTPVSEPIDTPVSLTVSTAVREIDPTFNKIPGQQFVVQKSLSRTFPATGQRDVAQKARGTVTISNQLTTTQTLIATTRFANSTGLVFRSLRTVTVPAAKGTTPGTTTVEVVADKPGTQYNIEPTTFTLPAFTERNDTERATKIKATSSEKFIGGTSGKATVVSEEDYAKAQTAIREQLRQELGTALLTQSGSFAVAASPAFAVGKITTTAKPDEAASEFTVSASGSFTTIGYRQEDLASLIHTYFLTSEDLDVVAEQATFKVESSQLRNNNSQLDLTIRVQGLAFTPIDQAALARALAGKTGQAATQVIQQNKSINRAVVDLHPFWAKSIPVDTTRITVDISHDTSR